MVRKAPAATKADIEALLDQFAQPQERTKVDWPTVRTKLIEAAKQFEIELPPYLARGEGNA